MTFIIIFSALYYVTAAKTAYPESQSCNWLCSKVLSAKITQLRHDTVSRHDQTNLNVGTLQLHVEQLCMSLPTSALSALSCSSWSSISSFGSWIFEITWGCCHSSHSTLAQTSGLTSLEHQLPPSSFDPQDIWLSSWCLPSDEKPFESSLICGCQMCTWVPE